MAKSDPNLLTQAEYARHRKANGLPGGSRPAVRKAVVEKRISVFGPDSLIDCNLADSQWARNTRARVPAGGDQVDQPTSAASTPGGGVQGAAADPGYVSLRARREAADAERAEIETAKLKGAMVMRDDVDRGLFAIGREVRDHLATCARRIASEVAGVSTTEGCEAVIDREHRIVLELLAKLIREKVGAPVGTASGHHQERTS